MRRLAAALIPFTPDVDTEAVLGLARDTHLAVRRDLAKAIANLIRKNDGGTVADQFDGAISILRVDPSYLVRSALEQE